MGTFYGHQLLPKPLWDAYTAANCQTSFPPSDVCQNLTAKAEALVSHEDPYALDFPVCNLSTAAGRHERHTLLKKIKAGGNPLTGYFPDNYEPCDSDYMTEYFNKEEVQQAIHVNDGGAGVSQSQIT